MKRLTVLLLSIVSMACSAQDRPLDRGLSIASIGGVDSAGFVKWSDLKDLDSSERSILRLLTDGNRSQAAVKARQLVQEHPDDLCALSLRIQTVIAQKSVPAMKRFLAELDQSDSIKNVKSQHIIRLAKARVLWSIAVSDASTDWGRQLTSVLRTLPDTSASISESVMLADIFQSDAEDRIDLARSLMEEAVRKHPKSIPARYYLLVLYDRGILGGSPPPTPEQKPMPWKVVAEANAILKIDPEFRQAYYFGGLAKLNTGDRSGAADWLRKYIALHPSKTGAYYQQAQSVLRSIK